VQSVPGKKELRVIASIRIYVFSWWNLMEKVTAKKEEAMGYRQLVVNELKG
jgi:hypothetical protein